MVFHLQCLKDSVDDLESLVDTALGAAESEAPTEGSTRNSTPRTKAAIGRQFHQAKSTTQNLLKALQVLALSTFNRLIAFY